MRDFIQKLKSIKDRKIIERERNHTIYDYWVKKAQLRFMAVFIYATKLLKQRRLNKLNAQNFSRF